MANSTVGPSESDIEVLRLANVGSEAIFRRSLSDLATAYETLGHDISGELLGALAIIGRVVEETGFDADAAWASL